ncbi:MAG: GFA family protein [Paracoccaceae bacterium]|jgi:hypothetical protein|nr:GFA family protein [Pseudomonadota bacterium]MDP5323807.1 GFA family protein [Paracoccaceae bacterium]MDP5354999.1 GFA family protein [Paracoccaceae bacterium]
MKHTGACHCGQVTFETNLEPMLSMQCNCASCRRLTGSVNMGMYYQEDEVTFHGEQVFYEYEGGSGGKMKMGFCPNCHGRMSARPEILEGVVGMPLGAFDNAKDIEGLKLEIWTSEKLKFLKDNGCFVERVEDSGVSERLMGLLAALEDR